MMDEQQLAPFETEYKRVLFLLNVKKIHYLPAEPGIYIIRHRKKLYCGTSYNIKRRVPQSVRKQKFGRAVYFYPASFIASFPTVDLGSHLRDIEARCISALYTIIRGNGLPFDLTNHQHANLLHSSAWRGEGASEFTLPLDIVQTVLHHNLVPRPLFSLPHRGLFNSGLPPFLRKNIHRDWHRIICEESERRLVSGEENGLLKILKYS